MKTKTLYSLLFSAFFTLLNFTSYAAPCTISNLITGTVTRTPNGLACDISIPVSFTININAGNKYFLLYIYKGAAPAVTGDNPPDCSPVPSGFTLMGAINFSVDQDTPALVLNTSDDCNGTSGGIFNLLGNLTNAGGGDFNFSGNLTITGPGVCSDYVTLSANLFGSNAQSFAPGKTNGQCGAAFLSNFPLPVRFGDIYVSGSNNNFKVTWQSLKEQNVKNYEIQASADAINWKTIGTVVSKAINGNSDQTLSYEFNIDLSGIALSSLFLSFLFIPLIKNRSTKILFLVFIVAVSLIACVKGSMDSKDNDKKENVYVRVVQHDIDGLLIASKVLKVVDK